MKKNIILKSRLKIDKKNMYLIFATILLISITIFLFGPLEIFLSEPAEFWFSVYDILPVILVGTIGSFFMLFILFLFVSLFGEKVLNIVISIIAGIGVALYIQGNWTFVNYGEMDGTAIDWSNYVSWSIIDTLIWVGIIMFVVYIFIFKPQYKNIYSSILLAIVGIEIITLGTLCVSSARNCVKVNYTLTNEGALNLSSQGKNVIVILADGFDGSDFLPILAEEPEFKEYFEGFTFYEDTCGTSLYSEESGITLLTGNQFTVGYTFSENIENTYQESNLYNELEENGYETYLYVIDEKMVYQGISNQIKNFKGNRAKISDFSVASKEIYNMVAFRYAPHIMKSNFWYSSMDFSALKSSEACIYSNTDLRELILNKGISTDNNRNVYQFYWIQGPHEPAVMDRYCQPLSEVIQMSDNEYSNRQFEQSIGVVRIFTELITALKEAGVYDNTTIIFTADHGWDIRPNPLLLIKPMNSRGKLQISDVPVSMIENYVPTLLYLATGNKECGNTIYDLTENQEYSRPFYIYETNSSDKTYINRRTIYYDEGAFSGKYTLGKELNPNKIASYSIAGISIAEATHVWTNSLEAELKFKINENYNNLLLDLSYWTYGDLQNVQIYANDVQIAQYVASGEEQKKFIIPGECITEDELVLKFYLPDAISPKERGEGEDSRTLALAFTKIVLSDTDYDVNSAENLTEAHYFYNLDSQLNFNSGTTAVSDYCVKGFSNPEETFTWTIGQESEMKFIFDNKKESDVSIKMNYFTYTDSQHVLVYANDNLVEEYDAIGEEEKNLVIPHEYIQDGMLLLKFQLPDAISPYSKGESNDKRELGLAIRSLSISYVE